MIFRRVNKQHIKCKSFEIDAVTIKKSMTEYHHGINGLATIYCNTVSIVENEYGESGHLSIFTLLKHLMMH